MANLSDWAEKAMLDWLMGGADPVRPAGRFVALFTSAPNDAGGGTEVSGNGYARQAIASTPATSGAGLTENSAAITFTAAGGGFGTVTHMGIFSAATSGNLLWHGALTASKTIADGDSLTFAAGDIDMTLA